MKTAKNKWLTHLSKVRKENPKIKSFKELAIIAKKSYTRKKSLR